MDELEGLLLKRRSAKSAITRNVNAIKKLLDVGAKAQLVQGHVDEIIRRRDEAAEICDRIVKLAPERFQEVNEWLDVEYEKVADVIVEAEITTSEASSRRSSEMRFNAVKVTPVKFYNPRGDGNMVASLGVDNTRGADNMAAAGMAASRDCDDGGTTHVDRSLGYAGTMNNRDHKVGSNFPQSLDHTFYFGKSLPKLALPKFDGDPLKWADWSGMFLAMIDSAPMTNAEKLAHLQNSLVGRAKAVVEGFGYNGDLYKHAYEQLRERFGKRQFVVRAFIEKLQKLPTLDENNMKNSIFSLASTVHSIVLTFQQLHYDGDLEAVTNSELVVKKMPNSMRFRFARHLAKSGIDQPNLYIVDEFLQEEVRIHEWLPQKSDVHNKTRHTSAVAVDQTFKRCFLCSGNHSIVHCRVFLDMSVDKRIEVVQLHKLCFVCLNKGHWIRTCRAKRCGVDNCKRNHHTLLHRHLPTNSNSNVSDPVPQQNLSAACRNSRSVLLQVIPVTLHGPSGSIVSYAMLDGGSTCSLLDKQLANQLGLVGKVQELDLSGIRERSLLSSERVNLSVSPSDNISERYSIRGAWVVDDLNLPTVNVDINKEKLKWHHLKDITFPTVNGKQINMLLGSDVFELVKPLEIRSGPVGAPHGVRTCLGWTAVGPVPGVKGVPETVFHIVDKGPENELLDQVKTWWSTESFGCLYDVTNPRSKDDERAIQILELSTC